jgi:hypothetical protein
MGFLSTLSLPIHNLMKLEFGHQDTYDKTFFYMIYMIYLFTQVSYRKHVVQVYILPNQFNTVNENTKQIPECLTRTGMQRDLMSIRVSHFQLQAHPYMVNSTKMQLRYCLKHVQLATCFKLVSFSACSLTLNMKGTCSSDISVNFQWTTQC